MKTSAFAVLCFSAIAAVSRLAAIDLVYTKTTQISPNEAGGHPAYAYDSLLFPALDPANGFLAAVIVDYHFSGRASSFEVNVYGHPIRYAPGVVVTVDVTVPGTAYKASDTDSLQGPQVTLDVGKMSSVSGPVDLRISTQITDPVLLNQFISPGATSVNSKFMVLGDTYSGGAGAYGNATTSIKFVFTVPDSGASAILLSVSMAAMAAVYRRLRRWGSL